MPRYLLATCRLYRGRVFDDPNSESTSRGWPVVLGKQEGIPFNQGRIVEATSSQNTEKFDSSIVKIEPDVEEIFGQHHDHVNVKFGASTPELIQFNNAQNPGTSAEPPMTEMERLLNSIVNNSRGNHETNCKAEYDSSSGHVEDDQWEDLANGSGDEQGQIDVEAFNSADEDEMEEGQPFVKRAKMEFVQPGNNVFYNDARHVDHLMIFGMKEPPQKLDCVPLVDTDKIKAGDVLTYFIAHNSEKASKNITVDNFNKWNQRDKSSRLHNYFYDANFIRIPNEAEASYFLTKYASTNHACDPPGSFIRRIWRGYSGPGRTPIGYAIVCYQALKNFKQFKFVPHKNSKKNNTPYIRKFPTTLEEAHQERQVKKPSSILAEANFKSLTCKDPRMLPTKANIYNLTRRGGTKYVNYYLPTVPTTSKLGGMLDLSAGGLSVEESKLLLSMSGISDYSMLDLDDTNSPSTSSQSWTRTVSKEESERLMARIPQIGDTTFHNNAHTIDMNVVFGLKESPQLLDCVPFVDPDLIQSGDVFTFYVKHENRNVSKDIPVDCFGKWNMSKSSSKCKSYFYSASFEKCPSQAEAEYVISKYSSTNYSCVPMGSFIRRIWRGYRVQDREPFGVAIVSYMANPNFEKFHFEAHKNAKHKSEPYIRRFPSTIEEVQQERASKMPADILAEAKMRTAENGEDLRRMPSKYTVYDTSRKINKKNKIPKGIPVELLKQFNIGQPGEENADLLDDDSHLTNDNGEDSTQKEFDFNPQDIIKLGCISQKMQAWPIPPGDNFFHNNAHQIDASIIFGLSQPSQLLNCVPVIDTSQIEASDIFTFYVNHTNEYVSKNIPVDSFGKWNMNRSSSKCKSYFYSATFEKVQTQAEAEYIISKYTSTNYSCIPLGSFIRRIWRGYRAQDRSPIGCAIVSYMANDDFERFHFEAHKNSRHNTEPYVRRFPTALEEAVQERQLKRPCEVMADASVRAHEHNDVRLLPTKSTLYNGKRRLVKRNDPEGANLSGDFSGNPESGYYEDDMASFNRYMDQYEEDQSTNDSTAFDPSLAPLEEETPCTMTLEDILNQTGG